MPKKDKNMLYVEGSYNEIASQLPLNQFNDRSQERLRALLQPKVEYCSGNRIALFGADYLQATLQALDEGMPVTLEVGMSAGIAPTPSWLAYLEMGVQRLAELKEVDVRGCLRFFSTASLQIVKDPEKQRKREQFQKQQARLAKYYLRSFHPDLMGSINLDGLTQTLVVPPNIDELEAEARILLDQDTINSFEAMAQNHGETDAPINPLQYALMHNISSTFGDDPINKGQWVAVGCASEKRFNESRHTIHEPKAKIPGISIAVLGGLSETPPYLDWRMPSRVSHRRLFSPSDAAISFKELAWVYEICLDLYKCNGNEQNPEALDINHVLSSFFSSRYREIPGILELRYLWRCAEYFPSGIKSLVNFIKEDQNKQKGYEYL